MAPQPEDQSRLVGWIRVIRQSTPMRLGVSTENKRRKNRRVRTKNKQNKRAHEQHIDHDTYDSYDAQSAQETHKTNTALAFGKFCLLFVESNDQYTFFFLIRTSYFDLSLRKR